MSNTEKLMNILTQNPNLPLIFMMRNPDISYDYGCTVHEYFNVSVGEVYFVDDGVGTVVSDDLDDIKEYVSNFECDNESTKDMTDEEFEKHVEDYIENNIKHYTAIIVYTYD